MMPPTPNARGVARAGDYAFGKLGLVLGASAVVTLFSACGTQDALVGAQDPEDGGALSSAGKGGTGKADNTGGSVPRKAGGPPLAGTGGDANDGSVDAGGCERCGELPHVRPDAVVECVSGACVFTADACEDGFAHCAGDFSEVGCEADLSDPAHCGRCSNTCGDRQVCLVPSGYVCSTCSFPAETTCRNECANLQNDHTHCGSCGQACDDTEQCREGGCDACGSFRASCGGQNGCGDWLRSAANCGSCGRQCSTVSMIGSCTPEAECQPLACAAGRADCDANPTECEAKLAQPGACGPQYVGSSSSLAQGYTWWALGTDGSWLATKAGVLHKFTAQGELLWTYAPPRGEIRKVALDAGGSVFVNGEWSFNFHDDTADTGTFFAKLNAAGEPAWERELQPVAGSKAFPGPLAVDGSGTLVMAVSLHGLVDVDPSSGVDLQQFDDQWWLFDVDADGAFTAARVFEAGETGAGACDVTVEALARSAGHTLVAGGTQSGCELAGKVAPLGPHGNADVGFITSLSPSGSADRVRWLIGGQRSPGDTGLVAYPDGSSALVATLEPVGTFEPELYLDDLKQRLAVVPSQRRYVARFSPELELQWLKVASSISSPAATSGGGLLALFRPEPDSKPSHAVPTLWRADGSSAWTLPANCYLPEAVGAAGEIFATRWTGMMSGLDCDLDPGPDVATVAETAMVSTYRF